MKPRLQLNPAQTLCWASLMANTDHGDPWRMLAAESVLGHALLHLLGVDKSAPPAQAFR